MIRKSREYVYGIWQYEGKNWVIYKDNNKSKTLIENSSPMYIIYIWYPIIWPEPILHKGLIKQTLYLGHTRVQVTGTDMNLWNIAFFNCNVRFRETKIRYGMGE